MALVRDHLGVVLRAVRLDRGLSLRELSATARVSTGYISEVERGRKEASSELLAALCQALGVGVGEVLRQVGDLVTAEERRQVVPLPVQPEALTSAGASRAA